jgi:uncharacterized lipoprotein YddW (UPF0748 family)
MKMKKYAFTIAAFIIVFTSGCGASKPAADTHESGSIPQAEREFRAAWVATVDNIDWPTKPGLSTDQQKKEALAILDTAVNLHLNAIILQVRPHCDAFYPSTLEPWSYYLTGTQGKAPEPYYDPLAFWIDAAHNRGLELHVWFNPYRAHMARGGEITATSIVRTHPDLAKKLPDGMYWLDPAKQETQDHSFNVVMDVVKRYDVDGVHFDDYFYPYGDGTFPDDDSWAAYTQAGGSLSRGDWRRAAVNTFVERVYKGIKQEKPSVKFGISPFGIWRPSYPASIAGFDQYNGLFADARLWLNKGWVDYWSPQLYWPINQIPQSFPVLLGWWSRENTQGRNLWPGMIIGKAATEKGTDEIINEIMIERGTVPENPGHIHFSMKTFLKDSCALNAGLRNGPYKKQAIVPPFPWLDDEAPAPPVVQAAIADSTVRISWSHPAPADVFRWIVYYQYDATWSYTILTRNDRSAAIPFARTINEQQRGRSAGAKAKETIEHVTNVAVTAVDRMGNESAPARTVVGAQH